MTWRSLKQAVGSVFLLTALSGCGGLVSNSQHTVDPARIGHAHHPRGHAESAVFTQTARGDASGDLWNVLPQNFQLPRNYEEYPAVQEQIRWFVKHQDYLARTTARAEPYMYLIYDQVQQRNLPTELVLLPIIESAYYPFAYSGAGASGLWQLMPGTASKLGLHRDAWYDGRRDIFASTTAALDYLTYLQSYFDGDWLLAVAAYDAGEGTVQAAVRRNAKAGLPTDFWSLHLPAETRAYVPRLLALSAILHDRARYNVTLPPIKATPYLGQVEVAKSIKLKDAAQLAGISLQQLKQLNPGYSRISTGPRGTQKLLLPLEKISYFQDNVVLVNTPKSNFGQYRVQEGDTLESVANRYHTTPHQIRLVNHLAEDAEVSEGRMLHIPSFQKNTPTTATTSTAEPTVAPQKTLLAETDAHTPATLSTLSSGALFTRQPPKDTVITPQADNSGTSTSAPITGPDAISNESNASPASLQATTEPVVKAQTPEEVGDDTADDSDETPVPAAAPKPMMVRYQVKIGDTLSHIAKHYKVKTTDIQKWNHLKPNAALRVGSHLVLYGVIANERRPAVKKKTVTRSATKLPPTSTAHASTSTLASETRLPPVAQSNTTSYRIKNGDTFTSIAKRFGLTVKALQAMNPQVSPASIRPGDRLKIVKSS